MKKRMKRSVVFACLFGSLSAFAGNGDRCGTDAGRRVRSGIAKQFGLSVEDVRCASDATVARKYDANEVFGSARFVHFTNARKVEVLQDGGHRIVIPENSVWAAPLRDVVHPYVNVLADYRRPIQAESFELFGKKDLIASSSETGGVLLALSFDYTGGTGDRGGSVVNSFGLNSPFTAVNGKYGYFQEPYRVRGSDWNTDLTWLYTRPDVEGYSVEQMGK